MIEVKFFGLLRADSNIRSFSVNPGKLKNVFDEILALCPELTKKQLRQTITVVNGKIVSGNDRNKLVLKDGDELVLLTPISGG